MSEQVGSREDGSPEPDFDEQIRVAFNLEAVLHAGGCGFENVVDVASFHTDPEQQIAAVLAAKDAAFPQPPFPNWTAIGRTSLSGFDFEIKVIARVPIGSIASMGRPE